MKRYALLDTDFISKTHSVQDDGGNHLIDRVMELPEYEFFCHAQIVTELNRYNADTPIWLSEKIGAQKIKSYTDQEILESLSLVRGPLACATYTQMLKLACDAFSKDYFSEHYRVLEEADYTVISREDYLKELERLDIEVGKKNNLGEIKSFVLLQVLSVMLGEQIYVFCSDDKNARNGATNFEDVRCISLVSVFSRLKEESNWTLADAEPYIESLIAFYQDHHQGENKKSTRKKYKKPNPLAKRTICTCGRPLYWHKDKKTGEELFYCSYCRAHKENGKELKVPAAAVYKKVIGTEKSERREDADV